MLIFKIVKRNDALCFRIMDALFNHDRSHRLQQSLEREAMKLNGEVEEVAQPTLQELLAQDHLVDQLTQCVFSLPRLSFPSYFHYYIFSLHYYETERN